MRFAHEAQVMPVIGSSTCSVVMAVAMLPEYIPPGGICCMTMPATHRPTATPRHKDQLIKRLRRIEGQVRGDRGDGRGATATASTSSPRSRAVQAALDKVALGLLDDHAEHCVIGAAEDDQPEKTQELMAAVARLMRRG